MVIRVKVPGSCGELLQGTKSGKPFLITCPINQYSTVLIEEQNGPLIGLGEKSQLALVKVLQKFHVKSYPYQMTLHSDLIPSKGMASSSADIAAVCQGAAVSLGKKLTEREIASIAVSIEPTDGVFFKGLVQMNQVTGFCHEQFKWIPPISILMFDTGGLVDTLFFHQRKDLLKLNVHNEPQIKEALALLLEGLHNRKVDLIGQAATISALANQMILCKSQLSEIIRISLQFGAIGVNTAHSGTVIGLLFKTETIVPLQAILEEIQKAVPNACYLKTVHLISGGCLIEEEQNGFFKEI